MKLSYSDRVIDVTVHNTVLIYPNCGHVKQPAKEEVAAAYAARLHVSQQVLKAF